MELQEATRQAEAHLRNATDQLKIPVAQKDLFLGADDQVTAIDNLSTALDNFLADTESLNDAKLKAVRDQIRDAKRKLTDAAVAHEAAKAGETIESGDLSEKEWIASYIEQAPDMLGLVREALGEKVKDVHGLGVWEEPLAVINGYLADSEPYGAKDRDLQKARSKVRLARKDLKAAIDGVVKTWKSQNLDEDGDEE